MTTQKQRARAKQAEYKLAREAAIERSYGLCELQTPKCPPSPHAGEHCHHLKERSAGGTHDLENLRWVCLAAHDFIHAHPNPSYEAGWLIPSWGNPRSVQSQDD